MKTIWFWATLVIVFGVSILRFVGLEKAPPGFHNDEAFAAVHEMCLAQTGHDAYNESWPLFPRSGGGGVFSPIHTYLALGWSLIFGTSIAAFRSLSALVVTLILLGLYFLSQVLCPGGRERKMRTGLLAVLAASLSPWAWQFSRMGCDDPTLMPLGVVWGTYFFLRSNKESDGLWSTFFYSLALYSYPPSRVQIPVLFLGLLFFKFRNSGVSKKQLAAMVASGILFCSFLIEGILSGKLLTRFQAVALRTDSIWGYPWALLKNLGAHISPNFLFFHGDGNFRHSSQRWGELSGLDFLALFLFFVLIFYMRAKKKSFKELWTWSPLGLCLWGFMSGILPAAMTNEGVPHALRSVGAWPFAALISGLLLQTVTEELETLAPLIPLVALGFAFYFFSFYFSVYPEFSGAWYDIDTKIEAEHLGPNGDWATFVNHADPRFHDRAALGYYIMHYGHKTCDEMRSFVK